MGLSFSSSSIPIRVKNTSDESKMAERWPEMLLLFYVVAVHR